MNSNSNERKASVQSNQNDHKDQDAHNSKKDSVNKEKHENEPTQKEKKIYASEEEAATKIQSAYRGYKTRSEYQKSHKVRATYFN